MKYWPAIVLMVLLAAAGCDRSTAQAPRAAQSRPATAPASSELLLLDDDARPDAPEQPMADNSRCEVCHMNLALEELVVAHAKAMIGCAKCHGECDAHIDDESWASGGNGTAPDVMFLADKINPFCHTCHPKDKIDPDLHKSFLAGLSEQKLCTACHGQHKLVERRCKWK